MAWAILEPKSGQTNVPGTTQLEDQSHVSVDHAKHLKKMTFGGEVIILSPQPSDDPNDPLNQPLWKRDLRFFVFAYCTMLVVGGIGPILSSLVLDIMMEFNVGLTEVSLLTGYSLCATGAIGAFISAVGHKYGKRIPLLFSVACAFAGTVWGGFSQSYQSMLGARVVQGLSVSMFESLFFTVVGDLYFVHERGLRSAIVTTSITGLSNFPSLLAGKTATDLGWRWVFWLLAIFLGIALALTFLHGEETAYRRSPTLIPGLGSNETSGSLDVKDAAQTAHIEKNIVELPGSQATGGPKIPRKPFAVRLNPYSATYTDEPIWKLVFSPFIILYHPVVMWAVALMAFPTLWLVAINLLTTQIFAAPPYLLSVAELGYFAAGPTVGGLLGALAAGGLSDIVIKLLIKTNNGVYEPEFRLFVIVPAVVLSIVGYFPFGRLIAQGASPVAMSTLYGVVTAALQFIMTVVGTYVVDAYPEIGVETFIATMIIKNFLFFGFSYFLNDWITSWGAARMFSSVAGIQLGLCLTTVPLYIYGKRIRAWWYKSKI